MGKAPHITGFKYKLDIMSLGATILMVVSQDQRLTKLGTIYLVVSKLCCRPINDSCAHLYQERYFRASEEEMAHFGELSADSVALEDGGYVAQLRVFNELQCMVQSMVFRYDLDS